MQTNAIIEHTSNSSCRFASLSSLFFLVNRNAHTVLTQHCILVAYQQYWYSEESLMFYTYTCRLPRESLLRGLINTRRHYSVMRTTYIQIPSHLIAVVSILAVLVCRHCLPTALHFLEHFVFPYSL